MGLLKFSDEEFVSLLTEAVKHVQNDEDLVEITRLKKLFKKTIPLSRRSYVGCYLAKTILEQGAKRAYGREDRYPHHFKRPQKSDEGFRGKLPPRYALIDDSLAATIFVSVGKNKRVFPRDLVTLVSQRANIAQDRIGEIHVFDNYSFIQLYAEDSEKVIAALNGCDYRGRPLSVSYSRKKDDAPQAAESQEAQGTWQPSESGE